MEIRNFTKKRTKIFSNKNSYFLQEGRKKQKNVLFED